MVKNDVAVVRSPRFLEHRMNESHPEWEGRLTGILERFESDAELSALPNPLVDTVDVGVLRWVHAPQMIDAILSLKGMSGWIDPDTYYGPESVEVALAAAGSASQLARAIWRGDYRRGFCLVRPPGHHATPQKAMGFCFFNNVAVAAATVLQENPRAKIVIVDFDLHHGNGTQDAFYENPNVLFISSHRYPYYPGTGAIDEIGVKAGKGGNLNFPIPQRLGDDLFVPLYRELIHGVVTQFNPDMILVSAGYDGHAEDPMSGLTMSSAFFDYVTSDLISLAEKGTGKILFCLEGGYNPEVLTECLASGIKKLISLPRSRFDTNLLSLTPLGNTERLLENFRSTYSPLFPGAF